MAEAAALVEDAAVTGPEPFLIDTTLREGGQAPGRYLSRQRRLDLVAGLGRIGIEEIEVGHAVADPRLEPGARLDPGAGLAAFVAAARRRAPGARIAVWCRGLPADVDAACASGADVVAISLPVSALHLRTRLRRSTGWLLDQVGLLTARARSGGATWVSLGLEDATRADPLLLDDVAEQAALAGVDRLRLADTVGIATPPALAALVTRIRARFPGAVGVHTHDDFGMATANAVSALQAGAGSADVSVLGLGERAGIARLEEVAGYLTLRAAAPYRLAEIRRLCHRLAGWTGRPIPPTRPLIGAGLFRCESGLHLDGMAKDPQTYQPYPPAQVGARSDHRLGRLAGRAAVAGYLREHGIDLPEADLLALTARIRSAATTAGRALTSAEVDALAGEPS